MVVRSFFIFKLACSNLRILALLTCVATGSTISYAKEEDSFSSGWECISNLHSDWNCSLVNGQPYNYTLEQISNIRNDDNHANGQSSLNKLINNENIKSNQDFNLNQKNVSFINATSPLSVNYKNEKVILNENNNHTINNYNSYSNHLSLFSNLKNNKNENHSKNKFKLALQQRQINGVDKRNSGTIKKNSHNMLNNAQSPSITLTARNITSDIKPQTKKLESLTKKTIKEQEILKNATNMHSHKDFGSLNSSTKKQMFPTIAMEQQLLSKNYDNNTLTQDELYALPPILGNEYNNQKQQNSPVNQYIDINLSSEKPTTVNYNIEKEHQTLGLSAKTVAFRNNLAQGFKVPPPMTPRSLLGKNMVSNFPDNEATKTYKQNHRNHNDSYMVNNNISPSNSVQRFLEFTSPENHKTVNARKIHSRQNENTISCQHINYCNNFIVDQIYKSPNHYYVIQWALSTDIYDILSMQNTYPPLKNMSIGTYYADGRNFFVLLSPIHKRYSEAAGYLNNIPSQVITHTRPWIKSIAELKKLSMKEYKLSKEQTRNFSKSYSSNKPKLKQKQYTIRWFQSEFLSEVQEIKRSFNALAKANIKQTNHNSKSYYSLIEGHFDSSSDVYSYLRESIDSKTLRILQPKAVMMTHVTNNKFIDSAEQHSNLSVSYSHSKQPNNDVNIIWFSSYKQQTLINLKQRYPVFANTTIQEIRDSSEIRYMLIQGPYTSKNEALLVLEKPDYYLLNDLLKPQISRINTHEVTRT